MVGRSVGRLVGRPILSENNTTLWSNLQDENLQEFKQSSNSQVGPECGNITIDLCRMKNNIGFWVPPLLFIFHSLTAPCVSLGKEVNQDQRALVMLQGF